VSSSLPLAGDVEAPAVFSVSDGNAFFCMLPPGETVRQLFMADVTTAGAPAAPERLDSVVCNFYALDGMAVKMAACGASWVTWNVPTGDFAASADEYAVGPGGVTHSLAFGYNQDGVHQYGDVVGAATDGVRAVFAPANDRYYLLADQLGSEYAGAAWATFAVPGPRRLLGVVRSAVYLATPDGIHAYDVTNIQSPVLLPYHASIAFGGDLPRLVASSERWLLVATAAGASYLVPLDVPGTVAPLEVYASAEAAAACGG
jgi:hypothetical protein